MTNPINPYQAPAASELEPTVPTPSSIIGRRLDFKGTVTRQLYRDAIQRCGIRVDYRSVMGRAQIIFFGFFVLMLLAGFNSNPNAFFVNALLAAGCLILGVVVVAFRQNYFLLNRVPACQLIVGDVQGWIDRDVVFVSSEHHRSYFSTDSLVSAAVDDSMLVLSFGREHFFFHVLPFEFFSDPQHARAVAADLKHWHPPVKPILLDERKLEPPAEPMHFAAPEQHVPFAGPFSLDALRGSR
ncbi:MAG: hypothetical protein AAF745_19525, partial [Planctomycetota bacterium]